MKRLRLTFALLVPEGRHCHPLALLLAGLLVLTLNQLGTVLAARLVT